MSRFATTIDLSQLAAPNVIAALDYEAVRAALIADFKARVPDYDVETLESDPAIKILEVAAYRELVLRAFVNDTARALLLASAQGRDLDHLGVYYGVTRLTISPATETALAVLESDAELRRRIQLAPEAFSTAGPAGAYEFHALTADPAVKDAAAYGYGTPGLAPGQVHVYVLARTGDGTASPALVERVQAYLKAHADKVPMTDMVSVLAARVAPYTVSVALSTPAGPDPLVIRQRAEAALAAYVGARHQIGAGVPISALINAAFVEGVEQARVLSPVADIEPLTGTAPWCTGISVTTTVLPG